MEPDDSLDQLWIATFDNEPLARLSQERLMEQGIPSLLKSLGVGSGVWGGNSFVPHDLYVLARDREKALGLIDVSNPSSCPDDSRKMTNAIGIIDSKAQGFDRVLIYIAIIFLVLVLLWATYMIFI